MNTRHSQSERLHHLGERINHQVTEITELNMRTLGKMSEKSDLLNGLLEARRPEEFIAAQMRLATAAGAEAMEYSQELCNILWKDASCAAKEFTHSMEEVARQHKHNEEHENQNFSEENNQHSNSRYSQQKEYANHEQHQANPSRSPFTEEMLKKTSVTSGRKGTAKHK